MSHRLNALIALFLTVALMALGAYLHDAQLGPMCPTWPLCPGKFADQGIVYFHRAVVLALIFCTGFLAKNLWQQKNPASVWANWVFGFVILQAILGALTAVLDLPAIISFVHLLLAMVTLALIVVLHHALESHDDAITRGFATWYKDALLALLILIFYQSVLGSLVRHSGAAAACGLGVGHLLPCTDVTTAVMSWWPQRSSGQLQMLHRYSGMLLFVLALPTMVFTFLGYSSLDSVTAAKARNTSLLVIALLFIQVYSGFYNIASSLAIHATVFHLLIAAALMVFVLKTRLYHLSMEKMYFGRVQISRFSDILELFKPRLAGLVMITMLIGALLAPGKIYFLDILFSAALIFMVVASATTLNCWMERDVDAKMERTRERALPSGRMRPKTALWIGLVLAAISLPALYFWVNPLTAFLGLIAHLMYLLAYTPLKKYSAAALFVGAVPGALPPVMGWTTLTGTMDATAWCLFAILFVWQLPHFLAISIYYRDDYEMAGIKIFARETNFTAVRRDIFLYTILLTACALAPTWWAGFGQHYQTSATVLSLLFLSIAGAGFFIKRTDGVVRRWARSYFFASIIYLPLLLAAMVFFQ